MKKIIALTTLFVLLGAGLAGAGLAQLAYGKILKGKILLQVQSRGEAWYVNPLDSKRYFLGRPIDAFNLMRRFGIGISDENLAKIPVGLIDYDGADTDGDGLVDELETALGTDPQNKDTDNDGHSDRTEILSDFNPLGSGAQGLSVGFANLNAGKIFLQVERAGQAWYVRPDDSRRYFLGSPHDAFSLMRKFSLGITNENLATIPVGKLVEPPPPGPAPAADPMAAAAAAIRSGNVSQALAYFTAEAQPAINYTLNYLDAEGKLTLGNILSGSSLAASTADEKIYSSEVYFSLSDEKIKVNFKLKKQPDGRWLIENL